MFAPLLFTDRKRGRFKGSLDVLWGLQMFLTNSMFSFKRLILLDKGIIQNLSVWNQFYSN